MTRQKQANLLRAKKRIAKRKSEQAMAAFELEWKILEDGHRFREEQIEKIFSKDNDASWRKILLPWNWHKSG